MIYEMVMCLWRICVFWDNDLVYTLKAITLRQSYHQSWHIKYSFYIFHAYNYITHIHKYICFYTYTVKSSKVHCNEQLWRPSEYWTSGNSLRVPMNFHSKNVKSMFVWVVWLTKPQRDKSEQVVTLFPSQSSVPKT